MTGEGNRSGLRIDDLQRQGLRILQDPQTFRFGMDAVLLADFASRESGRLLCCDLGTGNGILPLLMCARMPRAEFDAVEIQPEAAELAARSVALNGMEKRIRVRTMDLRDAPKALGYGQYDLVVSNPPYGKQGGTLPSLRDAERIARHEGTTDIACVCAAAGKLLRNGGWFCAVFPAARMLELADAMRSAGIEPKRLQTVHDRPSRPAVLLLAEGVRTAKPGLLWMKPLFVRDEEGRETRELREIYGNA